MFLYCFNVVDVKNKIFKKYYFHTVLNKKYFKNSRYHNIWLKVF